MDKITIRYKTIDGRLYVRLDGLLEAAKRRNNRSVVDYLTKLQEQINAQQRSNDKTAKINSAKQQIE